MTIYPAMRGIAIMIALVSMLGGCSTQPAKSPDTLFANHYYCDNYLMYQMCAQDLNEDGEADVLYFQDTKEVFMLNPSTPRDLLTNWVLHDCVQMMDSEMVRASSALHLVSDHMGAFQRGKIKARLMLSYTRYMTSINKCRQSIGEYAMPEGGDDFGDEDYEEL